METVMRSKFIGAAAAVAILASGLSVASAQTPSQQPSPQMQPAETPAAAPTPAPTPTPDSSSMQMKPNGDAAPTPIAEHPKQHKVSACQKAIQASEKALQKSQASPDTIAQAWQHISTAKQEKGQACKDDAKQAQEML